MKKSCFSGNVLDNCRQSEKQFSKILAILAAGKISYTECSPLSMLKPLGMGYVQTPAPAFKHNITYPQAKLHTMKQTFQAEQHYLKMKSSILCIFA